MWKEQGPASPVRRQMDQQPVVQEPGQGGQPELLVHPQTDRRLEELVPEREGLAGQVRPAREQVLPVRQQTDQPLAEQGPERAEQQLVPVQGPAESLEHLQMGRRLAVPPGAQAREERQELVPVLQPAAALQPPAQTDRQQPEVLQREQACEQQALAEPATAREPPEQQMGPLHPDDQPAQAAASSVHRHCGEPDSRNA